jgi:succinyl-diaminopimelate desuccinylase
MKGGIACFIAASLAFLNDGMPGQGSLSFLITGDEEGAAVNGTAKLLPWAAAAGHRFDACIVGEPTSATRLGDAIKVGRRGSLSGTIEVGGTQGHAAYPERADNPIPRLLRILSSLSSEPIDRGTRDFDPSNLEITSIDVGNGAFNVIPARASARFNIRFNDAWNSGRMAAWVQTRLRASGVENWQLRFEPMNSEPFLTRSPQLIEPLSQAIMAVTGLSPAHSTSGGTSDARFIREFCSVVEFGLPGTTMHQTNENVAIEDLASLTRIYREFLDRFYGRGPAKPPAYSTPSR